MAMKELEVKRAKTFSRGKRWSGRLQLLVGVFLAFYILLILNLIIFRHPARFDLTAESLNTLSRETLARLAAVNHKIRVVFPKLYSSQSNLERAHLKVLMRARLLLREYMAVQPLIELEEIDILVEDGRWLQVRERYDLAVTQRNRFIFVSGDAGEYRQTVTPRDLALFGEVRDAAIEEPEVKAFLGESALTAAITRLINLQRRPVYFTQDKQELRLNVVGTEPSAATLKRELETSGYEARPLALSRVNSIPSDCAILFVIRPLESFSQNELDVLEAYLQQGGRLFVALGPKVTGIETLLESWGIEALTGSIVERRQLAATVQQSENSIVQRHSTTHPITDVFAQAAAFEMMMFAPRPLVLKAKALGVEAARLLDLVSSKTEGVLYYHRLTRETRQLPEPGDFVVGAALSQFVPDRPPPDFQHRDYRLVVVSSASFLHDHSLLQRSHRDFTLNAVAWLAGEEEKATFGNQEWTRRTLRSSRQIERFLFWVPVIVFPGLFVLVGAIVYFVRRK